MSKRFALVLVSAALSWFSVGPAQAADSVPLTLANDTVSIIGPDFPATACDNGSQLHCGYVVVNATFSGLTGRVRPVSQFRDGDLSGSVDVTRAYGCQTEKGKRLRRYNKVVREYDVPLRTRRSTGFRIPPQGDTLTVNTYGFLLDKQPNNCPKGMRAMVYKIKATDIELELMSFSPMFPSADYCAPGKATWKGAVQTPTPPAK